MVLLFLAREIGGDGYIGLKAIGINASRVQTGPEERFRYRQIMGHNRRGEIWLDLGIRSGRAQKTRWRSFGSPPCRGYRSPLRHPRGDAPSLRRRHGYSSPRKPRRGKFHYRWQSAPSSAPQIRPQDTPAIGNVNQRKVSGLPVGSREPSGDIVEKFTGALDGGKAHNHSGRSQ